MKIYIYRIYSCLKFILQKNQLKKAKLCTNVTMYPPTTVSVGPIRSQKGRGVRKTRKRTTKRKIKRRQSTKRKINVSKLIQKILRAK